ncbi:hypothetical protein ACQRC6_01165 [Peptoniphilus sp. SGI.035]|uniref:hypothetical protein n=1 Tax=Peptoniphilus sp. SGI.035 TaxID=3420564 RepID=UPI003D088041
MKNKELTLEDKIKGFIILNYHAMEFKIKYLKKECERGRLSRDYLNGYLKGVTDFKNDLMEADLKFLKEEN